MYKICLAGKTQTHSWGDLDEFIDCRFNLFRQRCYSIARFIQLVHRKGANLKQMRLKCVYS